jgi:hypothetical protein
MYEWTVIDVPAAKGLLTRLYGLDCAWTKAEMPDALRRMGWTVTDIDRDGLRADPHVGSEIGDARVVFHRYGVDFLEVTVTSSTGVQSSASRTFLQSAFADLVTTATGLFGPPTRRVHGEVPRVEWRGDASTLDIVRRSLVVTITVMPNERRDFWDSVETPDL